MGVTVDPGTPLTVGRPRPLFETPYLLDASAGPSMPNYDVAPDGDRFLMMTESGAENAGRMAPRIVLVDGWFDDLRARVPIP